MPELPEVETVRRGLEPLLMGAVIEKAEIGRPDLRFPFPDGFCQKLENQQVLAVRRRAKYLIIDLSNTMSLIVHLGMTGRFSVEAGRDKAPLTTMYFASAGMANHDHVKLAILKAGKHSTLVYNDVRRFGFMDIAATDSLDTHPYFKHLGLEPLSNSLNGPALIKTLGKGKAPLKAALLDQRRIAGLGNIYVCEALYKTGLSPWETAQSWGARAGANPVLADDLATAIRAILSRALEKGGSTLKDYQNVDGDAGQFQDEFLAYGCEGKPCGRCQTPIARSVQAGRSTFFCPNCQKPA